MGVILFDKSSIAAVVEGKKNKVRRANPFYAVGEIVEAKVHPRSKPFAIIRILALRQPPQYDTVNPDKLWTIDFEVVTQDMGKDFMILEMKSICRGEACPLPIVK